VCASSSTAASVSREARLSVETRTERAKTKGKHRDDAHFEALAFQSWIAIVTVPALLSCALADTVQLSDGAGSGRCSVVGS
jgi:hypothetical protein